MLGELLQALEPMGVDEKVKLLTKEKTPILKKVCKLMLVDGVDKSKIDGVEAMRFVPTLYDPDRMTHFYPEFERFKRIFVDRHDLSPDKLKTALLELVQNIPEYEARFIIESILTKDSTIVTKEVLEKVYPDLIKTESEHASV